MMQFTALAGLYLTSFESFDCTGIITRECKVYITFYDMEDVT